MIIIVVGFMGAGKSTLVKKWTGEFPGRIADLDDLIAEGLKIEAQSLGDWIRDHGFEQFRRVETEVLSEALSQSESLLLSLGGGAFHQRNRELIATFENVSSIWIETPIDECWRRVMLDRNRPLVASGEEAFKDLYQERLPDYQHANYRLSGDGDFLSWSDFCKKYKII